METKEIIQVPGQDVEVIDSTAHFLNMAERRAGLLEKVKELAIRATNCGDWVDQNGTPYAMGSAAEKIRTRFALKIWDVKVKRYNEADQAGEYYYFEYNGKVGFNEAEYIDSVGTCSSRDKFFSTKSGKNIPQSEIDITNIQKSAYTNMIVNGITRFLGLRNLTWEELEGFGIKKSGVAKVDYHSGKQASKWTPEQTDKTKRLGNFLLANAQGDKNLAAKNLEEFTEFKGSDGKVVAGKKHLKDLSGKQIDILFKRLEKDVTAFERAGYQEGEKDDLPFDEGGEQDGGSNQ